MSNTKSTLKDMVLLCLLPVISLFSFFFYVFWAYPVQILSQELTITEYFLFDSPYLQTSLLVCFILFIALIITSKSLPKLFLYVLGFILVFLIGTFLYKYTIAYDFGSFIDNNSLTTSKSILGYSFWYFTLDLIFPILSIVITVFALKKNFYKPILFLFFLFYSTENITTLIKLEVQEPAKTTANGIPMTLSKNHKNVVLLVIDSLSPNILRESLTDLWTKNEKAWTKDFTFYDNVTGLSTAATSGSLPSLLGGYEFTFQKQIAHFLKNTNTVVSNTLFFYPDLFFYSEQALKSIQKNTQKIPVTVVNSKDITDKKFYSESDKAVVNSSQALYTQIPILTVSLYYFTPYIFRNNLSITRDPEQSFGWKTLKNTYIRWIELPQNSINIQVQDTEEPIFSYLHDVGLHNPYTYNGAVYDIYKAKNTKDIEILFSDVLRYRMGRLNTIIKILKDNNIYDSTRIIVTTDHGTQRSPKRDLIMQYLKEISTDEEYLFYKYKDYLTYSLPVFIMDKNFSTSQTAMKIDSRFLSLGDINNAILSSFDTNHTDYLITMPPKRTFNVLQLHYRLPYYLEGSRSEGDKGVFTSFEDNIFQQRFYKVRDIKTGDFDLITTNFTSIADLTKMPTIEYLE